MNLRRNPSFVAIADFLNRHGIGFDLGRCAKHPAVILKTDPPLKFAFPGTAGDRRSALNNVRDLKRLLVERGVIHA